MTLNPRERSKDPYPIALQLEMPVDDQLGAPLQNIGSASSNRAAGSHVHGVVHLPQSRCPTSGGMGWWHTVATSEIPHQLFAVVQCAVTGLYYTQHLSSWLELELDDLHARQASPRHVGRVRKA